MRDSLRCVGEVLGNFNDYFAWVWSRHGAVAFGVNLNLA